MAKRPQVNHGGCRPGSQQPPICGGFSLPTRTSDTMISGRCVRTLERLPPVSRESSIHAGFRRLRWRDPDSNRGHHDFQSWVGISLTACESLQFAAVLAAQPTTSSMSANCVLYVANLGTETALRCPMAAVPVIPGAAVEMLNLSRSRAQHPRAPHPAAIPREAEQGAPRLRPIKRRDGLSSGPRGKGEHRKFRHHGSSRASRFLVPRGPRRSDTRRTSSRTAPACASTADASAVR